MRMTSRLTIATALVITTMAAAPAIAANDTAGKAKPVQTKHTMMTRHQHHASLQTRTNDAMLPRGTANANANFANASMSRPAESTSRPAESMASQYGAVYSKLGSASDPICKPGEPVAMPDGQMHPCQ